LSAATANPQQDRNAASRRQAIAMMLGCTILGAAGQILIKLGAGSIPHRSGILATILATFLAMLTNPPVFVGYVLYALMTVLFVFALRDQELSILYPIISLTYVWVTGLSVVFFQEAVGLVRIVGVIIIVLGVAVLGKDGKK